MFDIGDIIITIGSLVTLPRDVFLQPTTPTMRRYEALRARFVEGCSLAEAARRFGYSPGSFRNLCSAFQANPDWSFFEPPPALPPPTTAPAPDKSDRDQRILALRDQRQLSIDSIARTLSAQDCPVSPVLILCLFRRKPGVFSHIRLPSK